MSSIMPGSAPPDNSPEAHKARAILKRYWGYTSFRPMQEEIIVAVLKGQDTLALLPTGGGKSLCYQVPALCQEGLCLVVSPLIALMKDQVEQLRRRQITAYAIVSGMSRYEVINILKVAAESNCRFLYVSPERLETSLFREYLPALDIRLIAVDEAHCISQWGYDFRPPYLRIAELREELPDIPVIALTASATPEVQQDIQTRLHFKGNTVFRQSFARPNLSYSVFESAEKINRILEIVRKVPGSSLIYCSSRKKTREISDLLQLQGIAADFYHAGLTPEARALKQERWVKNECRTMVCTNAFGMGIDKPDVRLVIHADVPECLENYYQEAGRAGRDGLRSYAVLLYHKPELQLLRDQVAQRFPDLKAIRKVYQSLMNYLQLPSGSGEGLSFDFDFPDFTRRFSLDSHLSMTVIKLLEREGWWTLSEQVFLPSRAWFVTDKATLYRFETEQPTLEPLLKTLLRTYGGIFDQPTAIQEKNLAYLLKTSPAQVSDDLKRLQAHGILEYLPRKEKPQLFFLKNRVPAEQLTIDPVQYQQRKERLKKRIDTFLAFIADEEHCRSRIIASYFGDVSLDDCGVCDNCLRKKKKNLDEGTFEKILERIAQVMKDGPAARQDLIEQLADFPQEQVWRVIEHLQLEQRLVTDPETQKLLLT